MPRIVQSRFVYTRVSTPSFHVNLLDAPTPGNTLVVLAYGNDNSNMGQTLPTFPAGWTQDAFQHFSGGEAAAVIAGHRVVQVGDSAQLDFAGTSLFPQDSYVAVWELFGAITAIAADAFLNAGGAGVDQTFVITPPSDPRGCVALVLFGIQGSTVWGAAPSPSPEYSLMGSAFATNESAAAVEAQADSLAAGAVSIAATGGTIPGWVYFTAVVENPDAPKYIPYLKIPSGRSQEISELEGHSSLGGIDAQAVGDPDGILRGLVANPSTAGLRARLTMGFPGMDISEFQTMHTMQLTDLNRDENALIEFSLSGVQRFLMKELWTEGGPPTAFATVIHVHGGPDSGTHPLGGGKANNTAFYSNGKPVGDSNPRFIRGNPIDILLFAMQNELGVGQDPSADLAAWWIYKPGDDSTLINPNRYLDVPGALALRDGMFSGVHFEFVINEAQDGKEWIEDQILKPLGLFWIEKANGQLQLKSMRQPESTSPFTLNRDNIIGMVGASRWPINNVVKLTPKVADGSDDADSILLIDDSSAQQFGQQGEKDYQAEGMRYSWGAFALAELLADSIFRRHGSQTPIYSVTCNLTTVKLEVGDFVSLTHSLLLDYKTGLVGVTDVLCEVIDRNPDYSSARVQLKLADTRFMGFTDGPYLIAPNDTPDWSSASADDKAKYMFVSDDSGLMSDGEAGHVIF